MKKVLQALVLVGIGFGTSSCVEGHELARDRASREYDCPRSRLRVKWISSSRIGEVYRVDGCGVVATYVCDETAEECLKESDDRRQREPEPRSGE